MAEPVGAEGVGVAAIPLNAGLLVSREEPPLLRLNAGGNPGEYLRRRDPESDLVSVHADTVQLGVRGP